jgi:hypothetical protein
MKKSILLLITVLIFTEIKGQTDVINLKKFPVTHKFEEFKTLVYKGAFAKLILKKDTIGRFTKKDIERIYRKDGVNFGGHYCFITIGCGNLCYWSILIDVKTGIVYEGVEACLLFKFNKNSRMLIANIPELDANGYYDEDYLYPCKKEIIGTVYVWHETKKRFIKLKNK